jgi:hypothetical protein
MKKDFNNISTDKQRMSVIGAMQGVERQLSVLAPAPEGSGDKGSVSIKKDKRANDSGDSFFASLLIDCVLSAGIGQVFSQAALNVPSWAPDMSIADTATVADEIWMDRRDEQDDGYKLGKKGAITGTFNRCFADPFCNVAKLREQAGWNDLSRRRELTGTYADLSRKLDDLDAFSFMPLQDRRNQPRPGL